MQARGLKSTYDKIHRADTLQVIVNLIRILVAHQSHRIELRRVGMGVGVIKSGGREQENGS